MKVTINVDITPEEVREVLGLPDVQEFQSDLLMRVREQMEAGVEGYDPMTLLKPYMPSAGAGSVEQFQRLMLKLMTSYTGTESKTDEKK